MCLISLLDMACYSYRRKQFLANLLHKDKGLIPGFLVFDARQ